MQYADDVVFGKRLDDGSQIERRVEGWLNAAGHKMIYRGAGAGSAVVYKDRPKRINTADLICELCGLRVESKGCAGGILKITHTDFRPWTVTIKDARIVACVWGQRVKWFTPESIAEFAHLAVPDKHPSGEPCLKWPANTPHVPIPKCG